MLDAKASGVFSDSGSKSVLCLFKDVSMLRHSVVYLHGSHMLKQPLYRCMSDICVSMLPVLPRPADSHQIPWRDPQAERGQHPAGQTSLPPAERSQWSRSHGAAVRPQN